MLCTELRSVSRAEVVQVRTLYGQKGTAVERGHRCNGPDIWGILDPKLINGGMQVKSPFPV